MDNGRTLVGSELFRVDGLVAVVTGGGTGIGLIIAKTLALNGAAKVYIIGRRLEKLEEAAAVSPHGNIIPLQGDVTSKDDLDAVVAKITADVGFINLLFCNSGISGPNHFGMPKDPSVSQMRDFIWQNWSQEDFTNTLGVNVTSVFFTAIAFTELLSRGNDKESQKVSSQIVVTASIASFLRVGPTGFAYLMSKVAVNHMAKSLSSYLVPYRIRVNCLNPGPFPSEMTEQIIGRVPGFTAESSPEKRIMNEADLVGATLYLCSTAGSYINGLSLILDGGVIGTQPSTY
ncbi:hypothetical protein F4781DRAFT_413691 [Annulohypoxylon bovei var. microspora]|nr:hypothetical protein F4781DRAFT_413691 [Annulohypoxylon bovei var. microspora]